MKKAVTLSVGMATVFCMLITVMIPVGVQASWTPNATMSMSPTSSYTDEDTNFGFTMYMDSAKSMDVYNMKVTFDWNPSWSYEFCPSTTTIVAGGNHLFSGLISIPNTSTGPHTVTVVVTGKAMGDLLRSDGTWDFTLNLQARAALSVSAIASSTSGNTPMNVGFTSQVVGGTPEYSYFWAFGDGQTSTSANPSHSYTAAGDFDVVLTVTDSKSHQATSHVSMHVENSVTAAGNNLTMILGIVALIVIIVVGVVAVVFMKKKKKQGP